MMRAARRPNAYDRAATPTVGARIGSSDHKGERMAKLDVTKTNAGVDRLLEVTENPRHRFLLQAYARHRFLEIAGRYEEIFVPEMTVENPVYHFNYAGIVARLQGVDAVKGLYSMWAQTHQAIFFTPNEQLAVADNYIASLATGYQQTLGKTLIENGIQVDDESAYYVHVARMEMVWPYDDQGRLIGEDVWEPDPDQAQITKLDPADVMTTEEAGELLNPLIKPLPSFDEVVLGREPAVR
jgi:hypothetical protein